MAPITPLIFAAALFAVLLGECELSRLDGCWRAAPRATLVHFVICDGTDDGIAANVCARLQGDAARLDQDDDFDE
jgi:hypothetical protein